MIKWIKGWMAGLHAWYYLGGADNVARVDRRELFRSFVHPYLFDNELFDTVTTMPIEEVTKMPISLVVAVPNEDQRKQGVESKVWTSEAGPDALDSFWWDTPIQKELLSSRYEY